VDGTGAHRVAVWVEASDAASAAASLLRQLLEAHADERSLAAAAERDYETVSTSESLAVARR
jgi:hypothetical protein